MPAPQQFVDFVAEAILSLPQDLKAVLRIVEDPDIDDDGRVAAAGALLHVLSASNAIPGMRGILACVDDVIVMRLILERLTKTCPEAMARHREDSPELIGGLDEQLAVARSFLGELMSVLDVAADGVGKLTHQGHTAKECAFDTEGGTWLYGAVHAAIVEGLEFDEAAVLRETKGVDKIVPHLRTRVIAKP